MDYKEKYNKLVEAIKVLQETNPSDEGIQNWVNDNVPELAESEDEKIMKEIAEFIYNSAFRPKDINKKEKWLTWFEKQGEQKPAWSEEDESMYTRTLGILGKCYTGQLPTKVEEELNWFKTLKERIEDKL